MAQNSPDVDENIIAGPSTSMLPRYQLHAEPLPNESEHLPGYAHIDNSNQQPLNLLDHGIRPLPTYTERPDPVAELFQTISSDSEPEEKQERDLEAWKEFVARTSVPQLSETAPKKGIVPRYDGSEGIDRQIIFLFFSAINAGHENVVQYVVDQGIVGPNTTLAKETPLSKAVRSKNVSMARRLLNLGADIDAFSRVVRIPLSL
jgi:hypothetical protein